MAGTLVRPGRRDGIRQVGDDGGVWVAPGGEWGPSRVLMQIVCAAPPPRPTRSLATPRPCPRLLNHPHCSRWPNTPPSAHCGSTRRAGRSHAAAADPAGWAPELGKLGAAAHTLGHCGRALRVAPAASSARGAGAGWGGARWGRGRREVYCNHSAVPRSEGPQGQPLRSPSRSFAAFSSPAAPAEFLAARPTPADILPRRSSLPATPRSASPSIL